MGNPAAAVKLVEYGSLSCPHCAHFAESGFKPLVDKYVDSGKVSYEYPQLCHPRHVGRAADRAGALRTAPGVFRAWSSSFTPTSQH